MNSGPLHLLLVRHAEAAPYSAADPDPALTSHGLVQAALLANWLKANPPDVIVSSTLRRAMETAAVVSERTGVPVRPDPRLREVGMCGRDGRPLDGTPFQDAGYGPRERPLESTYPDGERWVDFRGRVRRAIDALVLAGGHGATRMVIVCHGGTVDALFDNIMDARACGPMEIALAHTAMCHVEHRADSAASPWILHGHNLRPHMGDDGSWAWTEVAS
jgi:probable phosphoglycerate mutase